MSRSLTRWQALALGSIVLIGLALAGLGIFAIGGQGWFDRDAVRITAAFDKIDGIETGAWVRVKGIQAGTVDSVEPPSEPGGKVILHLTIQGKYRHLLRSTDRVRIVSEGLIGGKGLEIVADPKPLAKAKPIEEGAQLESIASNGFDDIVGATGATLADARAGKGTVGKLLTDSAVHDEMLKAVKQTTTTLRSLQDAAKSLERTANGISQLPLVGGYFENPVELLTRPNSHKDRRVFSEEDLFEPGRAVLTAKGRHKLDTIAGWLEGMKHDGSEVVVASFADPKSANPRTAEILTRQQSVAVCDYLKENHKIQKMGWFSSRKVAPVGMGMNPPPTKERKPLPPSRTEVIVFVPRGG